MNPNLSNLNQDNEDQVWISPRTKRVYQKSVTIENPVKFVVDQSLVRGVNSADELVDDIDKSRFLGECLGILRPIIYVLMIKKYGLMSYKPLLTGFAFDVLSLHFFQISKNGRTRDMKDIELNEYNKRWWYLFYWLLKKPAYQDYVK
jgi:peroxin-16